MRERVKSFSINYEKLFKNIKTIIISLLTTMVGIAIGWLFDAHFWLSLIIFSILGLLALAAWIFAIMYEKKVSILEMLNKCIKRKRYQEAVRIGYSVSRAFFLSGRNEERYRISKKVSEALDHMDGTIIINNTRHNVRLLQAQLKIDDCGWSVYLLDPFKKQQAAENYIKEGIIKCLEIARAPTYEEMTFYTVYRGLRHLYAMVIQNFDEVPLDTLKNTQGLLDKYIENIINYGGLLGYILNDPVMIGDLDKATCHKIFSDITPGAQNAYKYLEHLRRWCIKKLKAREYLWFSSYNPRIRYSLGILKADNIQHITDDREKYYKHAKENAIRMTLGYATRESDWAWLKNTLFADDLEKHSAYYYIQPDPERFVKGILLLGSVAMASDDYQSWVCAQEIFNRTIKESKRVNRVDSFKLAQCKNIIVSEMICYKQLENISYDKIESQEKIEELLDSLVNHQKDAKDFLGYADPKIENLCKAKKKEYKLKLRSFK